MNSLQVIHRWIHDFPKVPPQEALSIPLDKGRRLLSLITLVAGQTLYMVQEFESALTTEKSFNQVFERLRREYFDSSELTGQARLDKANLKAIEFFKEKIKGMSQMLPKFCLEHAFVFSEAEPIRRVIRILQKSMNDAVEPFNSDRFFLTIKSSLAEGETQCLDLLGLYLHSTNFTFTAQDFQLAKVKPWPASKTRSLQCGDFAFYSLFEESAFELIFEPQKHLLNNEEIIFNSVAFLKKWGYETTKKPRKGDLVLYCFHKDKKYQMVHSGIMHTNEKVISKFGERRVYIHDVNQVNAHYGSCVIFLRKVSNFGIERELKGELRLADLGIQNGNPKFFLMPADGIKKYFLIFIDELISKKISQMPERCLYGRYNLRNYGDFLLRNVEKIDIDRLTPAGVVAAITAVLNKPLDLTPAPEAKEEKKG